MLLANHYSRTMADGSSHIQWRKLVADVDAVFNARWCRARALERQRLRERQKHSGKAQSGSGSKGYGW
eukprot:5928691-Pleurochrysis_carterae.AAC.3